MIIEQLPGELDNQTLTGQNRHGPTDWPNQYKTE